MIKIVLLNLFIQVFLINQAISICWKITYFNGLGSILNSCQNDQERNGALCYPKCKNGYNGVGPVCWEICASDYTDIGAICWRNTHIYGKGCCCIFGSCCNNCPYGYTDDGCLCRRDVHAYAKKTYGRGIGSPMICNRNNQTKVGALCFPTCKSTYKINFSGNYCSAECVGNHSVDCGLFCTSTTHECKSTLDAMVKSGFDVSSGAEGVAKMKAKGASSELINQFNFENC